MRSIEAATAALKTVHQHSSNRYFSHILMLQTGSQPR